eukprot:455972-Pleurochrysis_carterae.AAC.1
MTIPGYKHKAFSTSNPPTRRAMSTPPPLRVRSRYIAGADTYLPLPMSCPRLVLQAFGFQLSNGIPIES